MKKILFTFCLFLLSAPIFAQQTNPCTTCNLASLEQILSFTPILFFILVVFVTFWKLNKEGYKIGDALKENLTIEISEDNPAMKEKPKPATDGTVAPIANRESTENDTNPAPPFVPRTIQPKSTSRLIAFISGLVSVGLACCITSFWFYSRLIDAKTTLDLSQLVNVLLALGIGVIPYAVNKISTAK